MYWLTYKVGYINSNQYFVLDALCNKIISFNLATIMATSSKLIDTIRLLQASCILSPPNQVINYREASTNQTINEKVIKFFPLFAPPFVATKFDMPRMDDIPEDMVCGALMKLLRELSIKYDYRYS